MTDNMVEVPWHDGTMRLVHHMTPIKVVPHGTGSNATLCFALKDGYRFWEDEEDILNTHEWGSNSYVTEVYELAPEPREAPKPKPKMEDGVYEFTCDYGNGNTTTHYYRVIDGKLINMTGRDWNKVTSDHFMSDHWEKRRVGDLP